MVSVNVSHGMQHKQKIFETCQTRQAFGRKGDKAEIPLPPIQLLVKLPGPNPPSIWPREASKSKKIRKNNCIYS